MASYIDDEGLRDMFRAESAEHLHQIESGLLELQKGGSNQLLLEDVFRAAHSLKGAARMLGLRDIQATAHEIENYLSELLKNGKVVTEPDIQAQLASLDRIKILIERTVSTTGNDRHPGPASPVFAVERASMPEVNAVKDAAALPMAQSGSMVVQGPVTADVPVGENASGDPLPPAGDRTLADFHISTIRVDARRLDKLMQHCGELVVGISRLARYRTQLQEMQSSMEAGRFGNRGDEALERGGVDAFKLFMRQFSHDTEGFATEVLELEQCIRNLRMLPLSSLLELFPRMVHDLGAELGKRVEYRTTGEATVADKHVIEELKSPIMHLIRNAIDHGIELPAERLQAGKPECGTVTVSVSQAMGFLIVTVGDDGRGLNLSRIREQAVKQHIKTSEEVALLSDQQVQTLIFRSGFTTAAMITDISGRGVGLDVVRAVVERLNGNIEVDSVINAGTRITLRIPLSMSATRAIVLGEWGQSYAIPFNDIAAIRRVPVGEIQSLEGQHCFYQDNEAIPLERLGILLDRAPTELKRDETLLCAILNVNHEKFAIGFDEIIGSEDIVVRPLPPPLTRVRNVAGAAVLGNGEVCPVLNAYDLLRSMSRSMQPVESSADDEVGAPVSKKILLADDSITTRMLERRILEAAGYEVEVAVDGQDAFNRLSQQPFDAIVSDVEMPRMTGLELVEQIRKSRTYANLPVILVTTLSSEADRRRGMEAGADAYISKPEFNQTLLLDCLARLVRQ